MASTLRLGSVLAHLSGHLKEDDYAGLATVAGAAIADFMTPEMLVENFSQTMRGYAQMVEAGDKSVLSKVTADYAARFNPAGALQREIKTMTDTTMRSSAIDKDGKNPIEQLISQIVVRYGKDNPMFDSEAPPVRNAFGEVIHTPAGIGPDAISPFAEKDGQNSDLVKKLQILTQFYDDNSFKDPDIKPLPFSLPSRTFSVKGVTVELNPKEYDKYQLLIAGYDPQTEKPLGTTLREELDPLVQGVWDKIDGSRMNAEDYAKAIGPIAKVMNSRKEWAKRIIMQEQSVSDRFLRDKNRMLTDRTINLGQ